MLAWLGPDGVWLPLSSRSIGGGDWRVFPASGFTGLPRG